MAESLKINKLVSPSWSWLKINEAEIDFDFSLENVLPEIKNGQNFISCENCGGLKKIFRNFCLELENLLIQFLRILFQWEFLFQKMQKLKNLLF